MIDLTIYLTTIGILSAIIMAFVIHSLKVNKKDFESQQKIIELQKQITDLQTENTKLKTTNIELQKKVSYYETQKTKKDDQNNSQKSPPTKPRRNWARDY